MKRQVELWCFCLLGLLCAHCAEERVVEVAPILPEYACCDTSTRRVQSIAVDVLRWRGPQDVEIMDHLSDCIEDVGEVGPHGVLSWFVDRGFVAKDIPASQSTRVRVQGFVTPGCQGWPEICGFSEETLSASYETDVVLPMVFVCAVDGRSQFCEQNGDLCTRNSNALTSCNHLENIDDVFP